MNAIRDILNNAGRGLRERLRSRWVQVEGTSSMDIKLHGGTAEHDAKTNACALCVAMNRCCFANEEGKMPKIPQHPNCRCKANAVSVPRVEDVTLEFPMDKINNYLFVRPDKLAIITSMGYTIDDSEYVYNEIARQAKDNYVRGNYEKSQHTINGFKVKIPTILRGKGAASRKFYHFYTGWAIYPNFEIKNNTPFAAWQDE